MCDYRCNRTLEIKSLCDRLREKLKSSAYNKLFPTCFFTESVIALSHTLSYVF
jgi:hypothetical protein